MVSRGMPEISFRRIILIALIIGIISGVGSFLFYIGLEAATSGVFLLLGYHMPAEGQTIGVNYIIHPHLSLLPSLIRPTFRNEGPITTGYRTGGMKPS